MLVFVGVLYLVAHPYRQLLTGNSLCLLFASQSQSQVMKVGAVIPVLAALLNVLAGNFITCKLDTRQKATNF